MPSLSTTSLRQPIQSQSLNASSALPASLSADGLMGYEIELGVAENCIMSGQESIDLDATERLDYTRRLLSEYYP